MKLTDLENRLGKEFAALRSDSAAKFRSVFPWLIAVLTFLTVLVFDESIFLHRIVIAVLWLRLWVGPKSTLN